LHKYVITDAIKDENVLKFSVEYVGRYKHKETETEIDIEVEDIDTKELMESPNPIRKNCRLHYCQSQPQNTQSGFYSNVLCKQCRNADKILRHFSKTKREEGKHNLNGLPLFSVTPPMKTMQMPTDFCPKNFRL
jgi:type I restriction enzyme R subunit